MQQFVGASVRRRSDRRVTESLAGAVPVELGGSGQRAADGGRVAGDPAEREAWPAVRYGGVGRVDGEAIAFEFTANKTNVRNAGEYQIGSVEQWNLE